MAIKKGPVQEKGVSTFSCCKINQSLKKVIKGEPSVWQFYKKIKQHFA